jgi:hypothetical protein
MWPFNKQKTLEEQLFDQLKRTSEYEVIAKVLPDTDETWSYVASLHDSGWETTVSEKYNGYHLVATRDISAKYMCPGYYNQPGSYIEFNSGSWHFYPQTTASLEAIENIKNIKPTNL